MKIGIDCRFWNESGVGRYTRNLVRELQVIDKQNSYTLFCISKNIQEVKSSLTNPSFRVVSADIKWHTLAEQTKFPGILAKSDLDLVHFPYFSLPVFYNRPFVVTIHDLILHHFSTGRASTLPLPAYHLKRTGYKFIINQAASKSRQIITVSEATKKEIVEHLNIKPQKVTVTYEGVDDFIKGDSLRKNYSYFLYVGNTYPHKNLDVLIHAFSGLTDTSVKLIIVGKKDYFQNRLKNTASLGYKNPNIIFEENVSDKKLAGLYSQALALISPSLMEGFGLPVLEAMRNNCLVLASDIPVYREICSDAVVYFDPKNREDIMKKMQLVLDKKISKEVMLKKAKKISEKYIWKKMAEKTLEVYTASLGK